MSPGLYVPLLGDKLIDATQPELQAAAAVEDARGETANPNDAKTAALTKTNLGILVIRLFRIRYIFVFLLWVLFNFTIQR